MPLENGQSDNSEEAEIFLENLDTRFHLIEGANALPVADEIRNNHNANRGYVFTL